MNTPDPIDKITPKKAPRCGLKRITPISKNMTAIYIIPIKIAAVATKKYLGPGKS